MIILDDLSKEMTALHIMVYTIGRQDGVEFGFEEGNPMNQARFIQVVTGCAEDINLRGPGRSRMEG